MFSYQYCEIFKNTYFEEHLRSSPPLLIGTYALRQEWTFQNKFRIQEIKRQKRKKLKVQTHITRQGVPGKLYDHSTFVLFTRTKVFFCFNKCFFCSWIKLKNIYMRILTWRSLLWWTLKFCLAIYRLCIHIFFNLNCLSVNYSWF